MRTAIVLAGGDAIEDWGGVIASTSETFVVAADSGLHGAEALGLAVDFIVGDLDSADPARVEAAQRAGARVERHRPDKDATDLELAFDLARREGATSIVMFGGAGGRLDHLIANLLLMAHPDWAGIAIWAQVGGARVQVARGGEADVVLHGAEGSLVTLLPVGGVACGIVTDGLQYPLVDEDLGPGTTRGVSNVLACNGARVRLRSGTLLVIQPDKEGALT